MLVCVEAGQALGLVDLLAGIVGEHAVEIEGNAQLVVVVIGKGGRQHGAGGIAGMDRLFDVRLVGRQE